MKKLIILLLLTLNISFAENISLKTGWNLIGINVNMSLIELKTQIGENNLEIIQGPNKTYQKQYVDNDKSFLNDFTNFEQGVGYWIKVTTASQITYTPESYTGEQLQTLEAGWNLINPLSTLTFDEITSKLGNDNILVIQGSTKTYQKKYVDENKSFLNDFTTFEEGHGYWVKLLSPATLNYLFELTEQAIDNTGELVQYDIVIATKTYTIKVYSNEAPKTTNSESTIAIHGTINGISTNSQLKLNSSYTSDVKFQVKVFDANGEKVVSSDILAYNSSDIYFGALIIENVPTDPEKDTTAPVITLNGSSSITLALGVTYNELGATALDETDGTVSVQTTGTVNSNVVGSYIITYTASDVAGNTATMTRNISVISTTNETTTIDRQVSSSSDDAEEYISSGVVNADSGDLELVEEYKTQIVGLRFQNLTIPSYALITKAYLQFETDEVDETSTITTSLNISAEKIGNSTTFLETNNNISARDLTNASVTWTPLAWNTKGESSTPQQTSDLTSLVQEIVDSSTWKSGNAMSFIISGTGKRVATSFDSDAEGAPKLYIEYQLVADGVDRVPPEISLNGEKNINIFLNENYTELGANANDNVDGILEISIEGTVNTAVAGVYTLTYTASDTTGNKAVASRVVKVIDPSRGVPLVLIRIEFNDYQFESSATVWAEKVFGSNDGQLNHYFNEVSYGSFQINPIPETDGSSDGIITVKLDRNHPGNSSDFKDRLVEAVALADPYIDYASYDENQDGSITPDELQIMFLVAGGESSIGTSPGVWAHASGFNTLEAPIHDGVKLMTYGDYSDAVGHGYSRFGEKHRDNEDASIGIIAHELGHAILGLPDLYDTDSSSSGIGRFGLMAAGSWARKTDEAAGVTPTHLTGWSKIKAGFLSPTVISSNISNLEIPDTFSENYKVYKVNTPNENEYFLFENRAARGYDKGLDKLEGTTDFTGGLLILHIDDNMEDNENESHKWVDVEEAANSGLDSGSDKGHINNLYFSGNVDNFTPTSSPSSDTYTGTQSGLSISNVSTAQTSMTADIEIN